MSRFKWTRESFIPKGAEEIKDTESNAVGYLYLSNGKWCALAFGGKRQKPDLHYSFLGEEQARARIQQHFEGQRAKAEAKAERRKAQKQFTTSLVVGDLLYTSWGYEQTNVEWFQVTEVKPSGKTVVLREVAREVEDTGFMSGVSKPLKDAFVGEPLTKRVRTGDAVSIDNVRSAFKWNGKPKYCSWYH